FGQALGKELGTMPAGNKEHGWSRAVPEYFHSQVFDERRSDVWMGKEPSRIDKGRVMAVPLDIVLLIRIGRVHKLPELTGLIVIGDELGGAPGICELHRHAVRKGVEF